MENYVDGNPKSIKINDSDDECVTIQAVYGTTKKDINHFDDLKMTKCYLKMLANDYKNLKLVSKLSQKQKLLSFERFKQIFDYRDAESNEYRRLFFKSSKKSSDKRRIYIIDIHTKDLKECFNFKQLTKMLDKYETLSPSELQSKLNNFYNTIFSKQNSK